MSIGILTIYCLIYRLEKFVREVYYLFLKGYCSKAWVTVPKNGCRSRAYVAYTTYSTLKSENSLNNVIIM